MGKWKSWRLAGSGRSRTAALAVGLLMAVGGSLLSMPAAAQIANTKHNLGTAGTGVNHLSSGTAEICVFCHTPHGADTTAAVPLWNRKLGGTTYTTYDSLGTSTLDGKTAPVGSVSIACLSCHDGTQSMSVVINAPGSGGYVAGGAEMTGAVWTGANQTSGKLAAGIITNLGNDLSNDHPIGIQYAGGGIKAATALAVSAGTGKDPDFVAPTNDVIGATRVWWVDTSVGTGGTREKTDMILYTRPSDTIGGTAGNVEPFVECASCHDPHVATNGTFLRISNASSAVCLACHVK